MKSEAKSADEKLGTIVKKQTKFVGGQTTNKQWETKSEPIVRQKWFDREAFITTCDKNITRACENEHFFCNSETHECNEPDTIENLIVKCHICHNEERIYIAINEYSLSMIRKTNEEQAQFTCSKCCKEMLNQYVAQNLGKIPTQYKFLVDDYTKEVNANEKQNRYSPRIDRYECLFIAIYIVICIVIWAAIIREASPFCFSNSEFVLKFLKIITNNPTVIRILQIIINFVLFRTITSHLLLLSWRMWVYMYVNVPTA